VLNILTAAYPANYRNIADDERKNILTLWAVSFSEDDFDTVVDAVKQFVRTDTKGFAPSLGQIATMVEAAKPTPRRIEGERRKMSKEEIDADIVRMQAFIEKMQSYAMENGGDSRREKRR